MPDDADRTHKTIPVVKNLVVPNKVGILATLPATIITAIVSPIALPTPRITPDKIPDLAAGMVTLKMVLIGVAPSPNEASL